MDETLRIKLGEDKAPTSCPCCGGVARSAYGFVYRNDDAFAVYHVAWSESHPEAGLELALDFGDWADSASPNDRFRVCAQAWLSQSEYHFGFINAKDSVWSSSNLVGRFLSRSEALEHPDKSSFLRVSEHVVMDDPRVKAALDAMGQKQLTTA